MNLTVDRVGIDRVKAKFESLKRKTKRPIENFDEFEEKY